MRITKLKNKIAIVLAGLGLAAASANAATVLVDISISGGSPSVPAGDGKYWNSLGSGASDVSATALVDSANIASGFSLAIDVTNTTSGGTSGAGFGGGGIAGPSGADPFDEANAITDGLFANNDTNGTAVFVFNGLVSGGTYDFSIIGGRSGTSGEDGQIIILDSATPIGAGSVGTRDNYALLNDGTISNFSVDATVGGEIWFEFRRGSSANNGGNATINAFSITGAVIPEPSSALLGGLGFLALLRRRR